MLNTGEVDYLCNTNNYSTMIDDPGARLDLAHCRGLLNERLAEPPPTRIQLVSGPRQVGKTTLLLELAESFGDRALYAALDGPEASAPGFWERLFGDVERRAKTGESVIVLLDEIQLFPRWSALLKSEWDRVLRRKLPVHIVATGSSALRLAAGSKESLAGRFERVTIGHWSARSIAAVFGIDPADAAELVVREGSYPGAVSLRQDRRRWRAYVRDAIIEPAIGRDLLALETVRKPGLLRQVFGACVAAPAQVLSLQKIQGQLQDRGALETVAHYLKLLEDAFLVAALGKYSNRKQRHRASPPKIVILNNAILAVLAAPERPLDAAIDAPGAWVENACLAHAWNAGQRVYYWREEPLEVDAVIDGSWGTWAIQVKTGTRPLRREDLAGLLELTRRHPKLRPLVICDEQLGVTPSRLGIEWIPWRTFLIEGVPIR